MHLPIFAEHIPPLAGWILAALGVIILGVAKSGFGGGVGIIAVPMFALAFGAQRGNAVLLPLLIAADVFSVAHHWGTWDKKTLRVLAPGTLFGIVVGSAILAYIVLVLAHQTSSGMTATQAATAARKSSENALALITGVISVLYVALDQARSRLAPTWKLKPDARSGFVAGTAVGVVSTLAHAAGPVAAIFLLNADMARQAFIGTTVIYFFAINTIKLIPYIGFGLINADSILTGLWFVPFVPLGTFAGAWMMRRMSDKVFRQIILVIVLITGIQLIYDATASVKLMERIFGS